METNYLVGCICVWRTDKADDKLRKIVTKFVIRNFGICS